MLSIDSLALARLDLMKIDVEGMEIEVLQGAARIIERCLPIILVEHLKVGREALVTALKPYGYLLYYRGLNALAIHPTDPSLEHASVQRP